MRFLGAIIVGCGVLWNVAGGVDVLPGDFDLNGQVNIEDIDMLTRVVATQDSYFDLTQDGLVDDEDRRYLIFDLMHTWMGDVNLDGGFDSSDLVQMFQRGEYEDDIPGNSTWADGDINGDGDFTSADFVAMFDVGGYEMGPRGDDGAYTWEIPGPGNVTTPYPGTPYWFGDLSLDQQLNAPDIDLLTAAIHGDPNSLAATLFEERRFDLTGDGRLNNQDRKYLVKEILDTRVGDANLDGKFNTSDLVLVFQAGEYEDTTPRNSTWSEGDWNGDLEFTSSDLVFAFIESCYETGCWGDGPRPAVASVPEPSSWLLLSLAATILGARYASRRTAAVVPKN